jgi:hypothetical protein
MLKHHLCDLGGEFHEISYDRFLTIIKCLAAKLVFWE